MNARGRKSWRHREPPRRPEDLLGNGRGLQVLFNLAEPAAGGDETGWLYYQTGVFFFFSTPLFCILP